LGYHYTKEKIYKLGNIIIMALGLFFFIFLFLFAPYIASFILGGASGGNTVQDITLVIRIVAFSLLIVPSLSVIKGYYQGHKFITPPSVSNVIEQLVRVIVILVGCYISLYIFHTKESIAIGISVFAATVGALLAFLYLYFKRKKHIDEFHANDTITRDEVKFTTKYLMKQIFMLAIPFIIVDVLKSSYNLVDTLTVVRTLTAIGYSSSVAETAFSVIGTWGSKLSMIIISISMGISTSLIPNIASDFVQKKQIPLNHKINQAISTLLFFTVPMTFGIFVLAKEAWTIFYGYNAFCITVFRGFVIQSITFSLITILINILQTTNKNKVAVIVLLISFISNAILNVPFMYLCEWIGLGGYQGASVATLVTQIVPCIFLLCYLKKYLNLHYRTMILNTIKIFLSTGIMVFVILSIRLLIPFSSISRFASILSITFYTVIGGSIYFMLMHKSGALKELFGENLLKRFYKAHD
jgi:O-antigen/teichoic acid export membrane protein